jgi:hypothetical protein
MNLACEVPHIGSSSFYRLEIEVIEGFLDSDSTRAPDRASARACGAVRGSRSAEAWRDIAHRSITPVGMVGSPMLWKCIRRYMRSASSESQAIHRGYVEGMSRPPIVGRLSSRQGDPQRRIISLVHELPICTLGQTMPSSQTAAPPGSLNEQSSTKRCEEAIAPGGTGHKV